MLTTQQLRAKKTRLAEEAMKITDKTEIYTIVGKEDGKITHLNISAMNQLVPLMASHAVMRARIPVEANHAAYILRESGIEEARISQLTPERIEAPAIGVLWEDGTFNLCDGNHRYIKRFREGFSDMHCYIIRFPYWKLFAFDMPNADPDKVRRFVRENWDSQVLREEIKRNNESQSHAARIT